MLNRPLPWARIRWPKAPTGSLGMPKNVRVTSHTSTENARRRGQAMMDEGSYILAALFLVPTLPILIGAWFLGETRWLLLPAVPFVLWRCWVNRRRRPRRS